MFIVYRGRGLLVGVVAVGCAILADFATASYFHDSDFYARNGWPKLAAFWLAAFIVWLLLPRKDEEVLGVAQFTQTDKSVLRDRDSLFWIPAGYWPAVLFVLGIVFAFVRF